MNAVGAIMRKEVRDAVSSGWFGQFQEDCMDQNALQADLPLPGLIRYSLIGRKKTHRVQAMHRALRRAMNVPSRCPITLWRGRFVSVGLHWRAMLFKLYHESGRLPKWLSYRRLNCPPAGVIHMPKALPCHYYLLCP